MTPHHPNPFAQILHKHKPVILRIICSQELLMLGALDTNRTSETEVEESPPRHQLSDLATNQGYLYKYSPLYSPLCFFYSDVTLPNVCP